MAFEWLITNIFENNYIIVLFVLLWDMSGPKTECSETSCDNGGVCIQQWESYTCDCDMTSFTGPRCEQGKEILWYIIKFLCLLKWVPVESN